MGTEHTAKAQQRRAGKPRNLPGYMWANTTYAYGTVEPPTVCEPEAFARAWTFDYLAGTYPHGLCDDCAPKTPPPSSSAKRWKTAPPKPTTAPAAHRTGTPPPVSTWRS